MGKVTVSRMREGYAQTVLIFRITYIFTRHNDKVSLITPIWTYCIELWGCACKSNTAIIQRYQPKILREIIEAPWYVTNAMIYDDSRYCNCARSHPHQKHQAPYKTRNALEPTTPPHSTG